MPCLFWKNTALLSIKKGNYNHTLLSTGEVGKRIQLRSKKMTIDKTEILNKICYTELVYGRINKKLKSEHSKTEIEKILFAIISHTPEHCFQKTGKNIYVSNIEHSIRITINSYSFRIITVDKISG